MDSKTSHRILCLVTLILILLATILHIISFSTSYWLVSDGDSPFQRLGFHEACFNNCHFPYCPGDTDIIFNGCYSWTFNELIFYNDQFREIVDWLLPPWFQTCKTIFIVTIVLLIVLCVLLTLCTCWAWIQDHTPKSHKGRDICSIALGYLTLLTLTTTTLLSISGLAIFGSIAPHRAYMPMSYKNHFGFSFWLELCTSILMGLCSFLTYLSSTSKIIYFVKPKYINYSDDMRSSRI